MVSCRKILGLGFLLDDHMARRIILRWCSRIGGGSSTTAANKGHIDLFEDFTIGAPSQ